jgi:hypothetical protein
MTLTAIPPHYLHTLRLDLGDCKSHPGTHDESTKEYNKFPGGKKMKTPEPRAQAPPSNPMNVSMPRPVQAHPLPPARVLPISRMTVAFMLNPTPIGIATPGTALTANGNPLPSPTPTSPTVPVITTTATTTTSTPVVVNPSQTPTIAISFRPKIPAEQGILGGSELRLATPRWTAINDSPKRK